MGWEFWAMFALFCVMAGLCIWYRHDSEGEDTIAVYVKDSQIEFMNTWRALIEEFETIYKIQAQIIDIECGKALVFKGKIVTYLVDTKRQGWAPLNSKTVFVDTSIKGVDLIRILVDRPTKPETVYAFNDNEEEIKDGNLE